jgi:hypothetical protein
LECTLCKDIESVKHLFFECIVAELLWAEVFEVFNVRIIDIQSITSKWLSNKRYLQFNIATSDVLWCIWNNRNSLVFNRKIWINMKQVWQLLMSYLRNWKAPFKDQDWPLIDRFMEILTRKITSPLALEPG